MWLLRAARRKQRKDKHIILALAKIQRKMSWGSQESIASEDNRRTNMLRGSEGSNF